MAKYQAQSILAPAAGIPPLFFLRVRTKPDRYPMQLWWLDRLVSDPSPALSRFGGPGGSLR
jgi:hypothetical protein